MKYGGAARRWPLADESAFEAPKRVRRETLYEFIPRVSPRFKPPHHLAPIVRVLDQALDGGVELCSSTPPRHTKTSSIVHWMIKVALERPGTLLGYATYNQQRADSVSATARLIATRAGLRFDRDSLREWRLTNGSKIIWGGVGGSWTGEGFNVVVVDDPFKDREEAESPLLREKVWQWFNDVIYTRQEPGALATSFIVNHTRWHIDDLIGRLTKRNGWRFINLPAINDNGAALWEEGFSLQRLLKTQTKLGPYTFSSLYQGRPIAKGASVFGKPSYYDALPVGVGYRTVIGADFAYTKKTWSDFNVAVVMRRYTNGDVYIVDVLRMRCELPTFRRRLRWLSNIHGAHRDIYAFVSGTEKGGLSFFEEGDDDERVTIEQMNAGADKFMRSQSFAARWNEGRVLLPANMGALGHLAKHHEAAVEETCPIEDAKVPWVEPFVEEVGSFTGVEDAFDDQVDAAASGYEPLRDLADGPQAPVGEVVPDDDQRWEEGAYGYG